MKSLDIHQRTFQGTITFSESDNGTSVLECVSSYFHRVFDLLQKISKDNICGRRYSDMTNFRTRMVSRNSSFEMHDDFRASNRMHRYYPSDGMSRPSCILDSSSL